MQIASELKTNDEVKGKPFATYLRLFGAAFNYKIAFALAIIGVIIASGGEATIYKFIAPRLFDEGIIAKNPEFLRLAPIYILLAFLARGTGDCLGKYFMAYIGRSTVRDQRVKMLTHMLYLPLAFFEGTTTGNLISKINYDAEQVARALADAVLELFKGITTFIFLLGVMFSISWRLTLIVLIVAPIVSGYFKYISRHIRRYSSKVQDSMAGLTNVTSEVVGMPRVIRMFQGLKFEAERINEVTEKNRRQEIKAALITALSDPIIQFIGAVSLAVLVYIATVVVKEITPGEFVGLFAATFGLIRPIKQIAQVNNVLQRGIAAANSIHALLDESVEQDKGELELAKVNGEITFSKLNFAYANSESLVLKDVSFKINPGETVAIVGPSGSGKSTLVSLLPRFYELQQGEILIDSYNINDVKLNNLREHITLVNQEIMLFNDTIANNIAYGGKRGASRQEIIQAATAANAMPFIEKMPQGLDTNIGENGTLLSGGQRQRLAIARAILKEAPILILDEATSSLDTESERYIQDALTKLAKERTTLVIAHRLSTIENADKVLVLEHGRVVEFDAPQVLLQKKSRYAELQQLYSKK